MKAGRRHTPDPHHVLRFFVGLYTLSISAVIAFERDSLMSWVFLDAGLLGRCVVVALALMGVIGIADVIVNDIMDARYTLSWASKLRSQGYLVQGALNLGLVLVMMRVGHLNWVASLFLVQAVASAWIGGADCWVRTLRPAERGYVRSGMPDRRNEGRK